VRRARSREEAGFEAPTQRPDRGLPTPDEDRRMSPTVMTIPRAKEAIGEAFAAALAVVEPAAATRRALEALSLDGPVHIVGLGKAACAMTRGAAGQLGAKVAGMTVITDHTEEVPAGAVVHIGDHPYPGARSWRAGRAVVEFARAIPAEATALFLVSGGASSLVEMPEEGLTVEDLAVTGRLLMGAGVPIMELNKVRRHLSAIKNGGLALMTGARRLITLVLSDVVDGPAHAVGSGPTLADGSTPRDALAIIDDYAVAVPESVRRFLDQAADRETPYREHEQEHEVFVVGDGAQAAEAAAARLRFEGQHVEAVATPVTGDAEGAARRVIRNVPIGTVRVGWGETTVRVSGSGRGGRDQAAALAAALHLDARPDVGFVFAALATDGIDGPTDAGGALVDQATADQIRRTGVDPEAALREADSYTALDSVGALVRPGPTGTNVGDLWFAWNLGPLAV